MGAYPEDSDVPVWVGEGILYEGLDAEAGASPKGKGSGGGH